MILYTNRVSYDIVICKSKIAIRDTCVPFNIIHHLKGVRKTKRLGFKVLVMKTLQTYNHLSSPNPHKRNKIIHY